MGADHTLNKIILFDGVCNLCSSSVQFIIKRDNENKFRFASLQSDFGQQQLSKFQIASDLKTIIYIKDGRPFFRSDAALEVARDLEGLCPTLYFFKIVPRIIRDYFYNFIAKTRYRW